MLPRLKSSEARGFAAVAVLLGATSLAQAAPPLGQVVIGGLSTGHSVQSQRGVLNLSVAPITIATLAQHRPQRFDESVQAPPEPQNLSVRKGAIGANEEARSRVAFVMHWHDNPTFVSPKVASLARNFHHNGLPLVHLWQSGRNVLAIGLNPRGRPGIYFTQQLPDY